MDRDLKKIAAETYDVILIGGGISGACAAWEAALQGLRVALFEKDDFSHGTSSATSKLVHGGLRYLKNFELGIVRESLRERLILMEIAPHMVFPLPFLIPTYKKGNTKGILRMGMLLYDVLSYDRKSATYADKRMPHHHGFKKDEVVRLEPQVKQEGLTGGLLYYDAQMPSPERLCLEFILSAVSKGAQVANYAEVVSLVKEAESVVGVEVKDKLTNQVHTVRGKIVVNVTGPWADLFLGQVDPSSKKKLIRSKGIHLITRPISDQKALVLRTKEGRHFFIIPWKGHSLIGTTDTEYKGSPDEFRVTKKDVVDFIEEINWSHPSGKLTLKDVQFFYGGLRPIVDKETDVKGSYDASRKYEIYDHEKDYEGLKGLMTVIGGKYTTSRKLAATLVEKICCKLKRGAAQADSRKEKLIGGRFDCAFAEFEKQVLEKVGKQVEADTLQDLLLSYGSRYTEILELARTEPGYSEKLSRDLPQIKAQIVNAVQNEMALSLADVIFRRTGLGTLGNPGEPVLRGCAQLMAKFLKWDEAKIEAEVKEALARFQLAE